MEMNYFSSPLGNTYWYGDALRPGERSWKYCNFTHILSHWIHSEHVWGWNLFARQKCFEYFTIIKISYLSSYLKTKTYCDHRKDKNTRVRVQKTKSDLPLIANKLCNVPSWKVKSLTDIQSGVWHCFFPPNLFFLSINVWKSGVLKRLNPCWLLL